MESCCSEVDRNKYSSSLQYFNMAVDFFAEAEVDQVRMAAMLMAHSVTAWKALWLKYWSVDNASKHSPCLVQFDGKLLFGKTLKTSIQQISGGQLEVLHKKEDSLLSLLQRGYICTDLVVHSSANGSMSIPPFPKGPSQSPIRLLNLPTRSSEGGSTQYPQVGGRSTHCMEAWADKVKDAWNLDIIIKSFFIET